MDTYVVDYIKQVISADKIESPDKTKLNGSSGNPKVWECLETLYSSHGKGGAKRAKQQWDDTFAAVIPDIAKIVNRPKLIRHISEYEKSPSLEWLIPNELPKRSFAVLYGASGAAKSFMAIDYAGTVALNENIVYVAGEGSSGYFARYAAWLKHTGHMKQGKFNLVSKAIQLLKQDSVDDFINEAKDFKPALVIFDTLSRCMVGGDENNQKDMGIFVNSCDQIREQLDCTVLVIHHTSKEGDNERGSSVLRGAADMMIKAQKDDDGYIRISCGKSKDSKEFPMRYCQLQEVTIQQNGIEVVSCVIDAWQKVKQDKDHLGSNQVVILECLASELGKDGLRGPDLKAYSNIQGTGFYKSLNGLIKRGLVYKMGKRGPKIDPVQITQQGRDWMWAHVHPESSD